MLKFVCHEEELLSNNEVLSLHAPENRIEKRSVLYVVEVD